MKKLTIILAILLAPIFVSAQNQFDSFEDENDVTSVIVTKNMFKLLSKMDFNSEDPEAKEYLAMVNINGCRIEGRHIGQSGTDHMGQKIIGPGLRQSAAKPTDRAATPGAQIGFSHGWSSSKC